MTDFEDWTVLETSTKSSFLEDNAYSGPSGDSSAYDLSISMPQGVGVSLISNNLEELLYLTMSGARMRIRSDNTEQDLALTIQKFQVLYAKLFESNRVKRLTFLVGSCMKLINRIMLF